jgi:hypothetical protein
LDVDRPRAGATTERDHRGQVEVVKVKVDVIADVR